jgi:hypothetical protein
MRSQFQNIFLSSQTRRPRLHEGRPFKVPTQVSLGTLRGSVLQMRGGFGKDWKLFLTALVRFNSNLIVAHSNQSLPVFVSVLSPY